MALRQVRVSVPVVLLLILIALLIAPVAMAKSPAVPKHPTSAKHILTMGTGSGTAQYLNDDADGSASSPTAIIEASNTGNSGVGCPHSNVLVNNDGSMELDGLACAQNFSVDNSGNAYVHGNLTAHGTLYAQGSLVGSGSISGTSASFSNGASVANGVTVSSGDVNVQSGSLNTSGAVVAGSSIQSGGLMQPGNTAGQYIAQHLHGSADYGSSSGGDFVSDSSGAQWLKINNFYDGSSDKCMAAGSARQYLFASTAFEIRSASCGGYGQVISWGAWHVVY